MIILDIEWIYNCTVYLYLYIYILLSKPKNGTKSQCKFV